MSASYRRCPASPANCEVRIGCLANILFAGLSGCLLGRCLLKTVFCCVRVSNHVPCRRVALLAPRAAGRGAGADVDWFCRLQCRYVDAPLAKFIFQSLCIPAGSDGFGPDAHGRTPRASAIFPSAVPVTVSIIGAAAAVCGSAVLSNRRCVRRRARPGLLFSASPSDSSTGSVAPRSVAARGPGQGGTTIIVGTSDTLEILSRRYNVSAAAIMQANGYKGPRALSPGQQLIIPHPTASVAAAPRLPRR